MNLLIHPVSAVVIGCLAGLISVVGYRFLSVNFFKLFPAHLLPLQSVAINFIFFFILLIYLCFSPKCWQMDASQVNNLHELIK